MKISCRAALLLFLLGELAIVQAQYTFTTNNGSITITGYTGPGGAVTIPETLKGLPVTSIGDYAFVGCSSLTSVTISRNVTSIGDYAFDNCSSLTSVTIGTNVTSIGDDAFSSCGSLTAITIPNSVTSIGNGAFAGCGSMTTITVDTRNPVYSDADGVLFDQRQTLLVAYPGGKAGGYAIPDTVTSIGEFAFFLCTSLTSVTIGTNVTSIGEAAFIRCTNLRAITIPNSVTSIGIHVFAGCTSLINATIDSVTSIEEGMFSGCTSLTNLMIGNSVSSIRVFAFAACYHLTSVAIPNSVTNIGYGAFFECMSLTSVRIPNSITSIGGEVFYWCTALTNVTIPNSVTNIGGFAFYGCDLTSVTIPDSVTSIENQAFGYDLRLTSVYFQGNAPSFGEDIFDYYPQGVPGTRQVWDPATVYYFPGTTGWGATYGNRPTALWFLPNPLILTIGNSFGVQTNKFGFIISWATNIPVVVEASTNLASRTWSPISTNTLTNGSIYFTDPQWKNYPSRFYRLRSP